MSNGESSGSDKHAALIDYLLEIVGCSRESFGMCTTLRCLKRGGYVKDEQRKPTDPNIATCEVREIIAVLRASLSAVPSNDGLVKELSLYLPDVNGKVHLSTPMMGRVLAALRSAPSAERRGDRFERFHEILTDIEEGRWHGVAGKVQALRDDVCALTPPSSASTSPAGKGCGAETVAGAARILRTCAQGRPLSDLWRTVHRERARARPMRERALRHGRDRAGGRHRVPRTQYRR
jgi:hypothetical protein